MAPSPDSPLVFLDASVVFAAALSAHGYARDLIEFGAKGEIALVSCSVAFEEIRRNLAKKAPVALTAFQDFERLGFIAIVDPTEEIVTRVAAVVEPKDAPIIAGAIASTAAYVASYDRKHLITHADTIREAFGVIVDTPEVVLEMLGYR